MSFPAVPSNSEPVCSKCHKPTQKVYNCAHTDFEEYCAECYTELHYYLTESGAIVDEDDDDDNNNNDADDVGVDNAYDTDGSSNVTKNKCREPSEK